ncbi:MAG: hypothetical protein ACK5V3_02390 [Bdellovibrionales bacterium]
MNLVFFIIALFPILAMSQSGLRAPASSNNYLKLWEETNPKTNFNMKDSPTLLDCQKSALSISEANVKRDEIIGFCLQPAVGRASGSEEDYERCHAIVRLIYDRSLKGQYRKVCEEDLRFYKCEAEAQRLDDKAKAQRLYKCLVKHASSVPYVDCEEYRKKALDLAAAQKVTIEKEFEIVKRKNFCDLPTRAIPGSDLEPAQR